MNSPKLGKSFPSFFNFYEKNNELTRSKPKKIHNSTNNLQWVIPKSTAHIPPADHPWYQTAQIEYLKKLAKMSR